MSEPKLHSPPEMPDPAHTAPNINEKYSAKSIAEAAITSALDQKALDIRGLELFGMSDVADYFVVCSGTSDRHVQGIAEKIRLALRDLGEQPISVTGLERAEWVLLDYGDVVVHIFYEPTRQYYRFDELWQKAPELPLPPEMERQARRLRTGVIN